MGLTKTVKITYALKDTSSVEMANVLIFIFVAMVNIGVLMDLMKIARISYAQKDISSVKTVKDVFTSANCVMVITNVLMDLMRFVKIVHLGARMAFVCGTLSKSVMEKMIVGTILMKKGAMIYKFKFNQIHLIMLYLLFTCWNIHFIL